MRVFELESNIISTLGENASYAFFINSFNAIILLGIFSDSSLNILPATVIGTCSTLLGI